MKIIFQFAKFKNLIPYVEIRERDSYLRDSHNRNENLRKIFIENTFESSSLTGNEPSKISKNRPDIGPARKTEHDHSSPYPGCLDNIAGPQKIKVWAYRSYGFSAIESKVCQIVKENHNRIAIFSRKEEKLKKNFHLFRLKSKGIAEGIREERS